MQMALIGDLETAVRWHRASLVAEREVAAASQLRSDEQEQALPFLVQAEPSNTSLFEWIASNRDELDGHLLKHGGILFRGFGIETADQFEEVIETVSGRLLDYTYRSTPRTIVSGKIYTSTEYPPHQTIPLHNENSYTRDWPMKIWFSSRICATSGGETPIADSRRVYQRIPREVRERFERKGVMYVRNYGSGFDLPWQEVFQTSDRADVEEFCRKLEMQFEWLPNDRLRTRQVCQAVASHPVTGEIVWFNQAHLFHVSRLPEEVRDAMLTIFNEEDLPRNVYFGDGAAIDSADLDLICEAYEHEKVAFQWEQGDVLLLDNMLTAHARNSFTGERQVVVGMAEPHSAWRNLLSCAAAS
jgi:alpha-ketoglutarate-dependent taurine dioxygenase